MDMRQISPDYFVAPQIMPEDLDGIAKAGVKTVICNRPDDENPPSLFATEIETAAAEAGLTFVYLPLTQQTMTPQNVARHKEMIAASGGPVLAYCASGTRSTVVWALGSAGDVAVDEIVTAARGAGYDLENLRPTLEAAAAHAR